MIKTGIISFMGAASGEEVDYESFDIVADLNTDSDHAWSTSGNDCQDKVIRVYCLGKLAVI